MFLRYVQRSLLFESADHWWLFTCTDDVEEEEEMEVVNGTSW